MRIVAFWSIVLASLLAVAGLVFSLVGFIGGNNIGMGITGVVLIVVPLAAAIMLQRKANAEGRPAFDAALGQGFKSDLLYWKQASGIAIDKSAGLLALGEAGGTRIVPVNAVTEVSHVAPRVGAVYSSGIMAVFAAFSQIGAAMHNFSQAGLYVAANGQRTRIIGMPEAAGNEWQSLISAAKASVRA